MIIRADHQIVSAELNDKGELEVVRRYHSNSVYASYPPQQVPDKIIKEIYSVKDGKIYLKETIEGTHIPSKVTNEQIIFD